MVILSELFLESANGKAGEMALCFNLTPSRLSFSILILNLCNYCSPMLCNNSIALQPKLHVGSRVEAPFVLNKRGAVLVQASSAHVDGTSDTATLPSDGAEEKIPIENLPLESKLKLKLEQKMRMKMAKKIRLRRKRLLRKHHLRKKGQWPPSKLKNKNV